ncbi:hypothetical protein HWV62_35672, partial [Athelia sp. TMB]
SDVLAPVFAPAPARNVDDPQITALRANLDETHAAVAALRRRLEEVERRVARGEELAASASCSPTSPASLPRKAIARALAWVFPAHTRSQRKIAAAGSKSTEDPPVSALPGYVLLVSLGMCAVVLRVVLRRVGRSKGLGLGA